MGKNSLGEGAVWDVAFSKDPQQTYIYVADGRFVHAPSRGRMVRVDRLDDRYWKPRFAGARRVLGESGGARQ